MNKEALKAWSETRIEDSSYIVCGNCTWYSKFWESCAGKRGKVKKWVPHVCSTYDQTEASKFGVVTRYE